MGLEGHDKRQKNNNLRKYGVPSWKPIQLTMQCLSDVFQFQSRLHFLIFFHLHILFIFFPFAGRFPFALSAPPSEAWRQVHRPPSHTKHCCGESTMVSRVVIVVAMMVMIVHLHTPYVAIHLSTPKLQWVGFGICHCCHMLLCWSILMFWSWWLWWWWWWWSLMEW